jgi:lipopolysaccharide export system permease protein
MYNNRQKLEIKSQVVQYGEYQYSIDATKVNLENKQKISTIIKAGLFDKFVIAYACIMMFIEHRLLLEKEV